MTASASAAGATVRTRTASIFGGRAARQSETLQHLVTRHIKDPALAELVSVSEFAPTSTERGVAHYEHVHLVTSIDVLNAYQQDRRAKSSIHVFGMRAGMSSRYRKDSRTRLIELLKRWLRTNASSDSVGEDEVRSVSGLCRDVLNHPQLFPARNPRSFLRTIAEVYDHLQLQLGEELGRDRTCAQLAKQVFSLSRNLISDAVSYLLLATTDLKQTDSLPSLEIVSLWQSLPTEGHPLPKRTDKAMQSIMKDAWLTRSGSLIAAVLQTPWCVRLFEGAAAQDEAAVGACDAHSDAVTALIAEVRGEFAKGNFKNCGLAGAFRKEQDVENLREHYLATVEIVFDLVYLLGEAFVQFHRLSEGLGDYGMIRVAPWLHPFLESLTDKVQRLKSHLEGLKKAAESAYVLKKAREGKIEKPAPSDRMCNRAYNAIARAVDRGDDSHAAQLLQALKSLRERSARERLPHLMKSLGDACHQLQSVLMSPEFRARIGDGFPELPPLSDVASASGTQIALSFGPAAPIEFASVASDDSDAGEEQKPVARAPVQAPVAVVKGAPESIIACASPCRSRRQSVTGETGSRNPFADDLSNSFADDDVGLTAPPEGKNPFANDEAVSAQPLARRSFRSCSAYSRATSGSSASSTSTLSSSSCQSLPVVELGRGLRADVARLTSATGRVHDRRSLCLLDGKLHVYDKSSVTKVKTIVIIKDDVEDCQCVHGNVLCMVLQRVPRGRSRQDGVMEVKSYFFRFASAEVAQEFLQEISRHRAQ